MALTPEDLMQAFPRGIILAWYAKSGSIPPDWAVCDGSNGTPDLRGRFIRGVSDFVDVGPTGGQDTNQVVVSEDSRKGSDWRWGDTPWNSGSNPARPTTQTISNLPPYVDILYIMYVGRR